MPRATLHPPLPRQDVARQLGSARRRLFLASTAAALATPLALWSTGASSWIWQRLLSSPVERWLALVVWVLIVLSVLAAVQLPFSWLSGFRLAHRFGLSRQSAPAWLADWLKATLLGLLFAGLALVVFYAAVWLAGPFWWVLVALGASLASVFVTFIAPYWIVPLFFRLSPLDDDDLVGSIRQLSQRAGAEVRAICTLDFSRKTIEANAAVIGLGRSRRVVLADTLLSEFTLNEIEAVVAHELGHHVHRDIARLLLCQTVLIWSGLALAAAFGDLLLQRLGAIAGLLDPATLPLVLLGSELFGLLTMPLVNAVSRRLEAQADAFAVHLTQAPAAFVAAMRKLATQNLAEARPPRWAELLLSSHPPIADRITFAEALGSADSTSMMSSAWQPSARLLTD